MPRPGRLENGRPSKLTPEVQAKIVQAIADGNTREHAAGCVGIAVDTLYQWMSKGRAATKPIYVKFVQAVEKAEAQAVAKNVKIVQTAAPKCWQAAAWWLERRHWKDYGRHDHLRSEISGRDGRPIELVEVSDADLDAISRVNRLSASSQGNGQAEP